MIVNIFFREAAFQELGVYSKNDGNAVGIFSPKNVRTFFLLFKDRYPHFSSHHIWLI
jgi:hypothetical protein